MAWYRDFLTDFVFLFRERFLADKRLQKDTRTAQLALAEQATEATMR
jgi:hypothetical protein